MAEPTRLDKYVASFFSDRSPLYTTFTLSWIVSNWKFFYVTLFIPHDKIPVGFPSKLAYAASFLDWWPSLGYPLIATFALIVIFPFAGHWAYWVSLFYKNWRRQARYDTLDKKRLFTYDEVQEITAGYRQRDEANLGEIRRIDGLRKAAEEIATDARSEGRSFKIIAAFFGAQRSWNNVLEDLGKVESGEDTLFVTPNSFKSGDPLPGQLKQFVMIYRDGDGHLLNLNAVEGDSIKRRENSFDLFKRP